MAAPLLSAILIVKDEEANLPRCLRSLAGVADEIVVVDTGSTDRTREIAREAGAVLGDFPWNGCEADARNASVALATGRWLFQIDADEELSPELREELRRGLPAVDAGPCRSASLVLQNLYGDGATSRSRIIRLGRNEPGYAFAGVVHPAPLYRGPLHEFRGELLHDGYRWTPETRARKGRHLLALLEQRPEADKAFLRHYSERLTALLIADDETAFRAAWEDRRRFDDAELHEGPGSVYWSHALGNALGHFEAAGDFETAAETARAMLAHRPTHVRAALHAIRGAARREAWEEVLRHAAAFARFDFSAVDDLQSLPGGAEEAVAAWAWLASKVLRPPTEPEAVPLLLWTPALLPILWRAAEAAPGRLLLPDRAASGLLALRDEEKEDERAKIDRLTAAVLERAASGSPERLLALVHRFRLNARLGRKEENLALAREAAERHGTIRWLGLALGPGDFGTFVRRALERVGA